METNMHEIPLKGKYQSVKKTDWHLTEFSIYGRNII